jgi:hypothetical protein
LILRESEQRRDRERRAAIDESTGWRAEKTEESLKKVGYRRRKAPGDRSTSAE